MTSEYLLNAIGLLDDDLLQEAETVPAHKPASWRRWGSLAACAVLVVALGYGAAHLPGMGGSNSSSTASQGIAGESNSSCSAESSSADEYTSDNVGSIEPTESGIPESGNVIYIDGNTYVLYGVVEELPEDCRLLGTLSALDPDGPSPSTTAEEYVGCQLWAPDEANPAEVYVQLPDGGWAAAQLAQP